jgi:hypothetical protein
MSIKHLSNVTVYVNNAIPDPSDYRVSAHPCQRRRNAGQYVSWLHGADLNANTMLLPLFGKALYLQRACVNSTELFTRKEPAVLKTLPQAGTERDRPAVRGNEGHVPMLCLFSVFLHSLRWFPLSDMLRELWPVWSAMSLCIEGL